MRTMTDTLPRIESLDAAGTRGASAHLKYFYNARILTMAPHSPYAGHMMVAGDRILACSDEVSPLGIDHRLPGFDDTRRRHAADIEFIDLQGRAVIPGMTDSHGHIMMWALNLLRAELAPARSEEDAVRIVREFARHKRPGEWILGFGWAHNLWDNPVFPSRESLDAAFPDNPVFLNSKCGHVGWANSAALAAAGITADSPNPPGGEIVRTGEGTSRRPTGILLENACWLLEEIYGSPSDMDRLGAVREAQRRAHALGITGMHSPEDMVTWEFLQRMHQRDELTLRINYLLPAAYLDHFEKARIRHGVGNHQLRVGGVKLFTDGSLGGRTGFMYEPYEGEPENTGMCVTDRAEITRITLQANAAGLPMAIHAIGDRAVGDVLAAFEASAYELGDSVAAHTHPPVRNRIEHLQTYSPRDEESLRRTRPVASVQPVHLCADMGPADRYLGARARHTYAFRTLQGLGCLLAFGSDTPVEPINPMFGLFAAVTRQNLEGHPAQGWFPEERLTVTEALTAYTRNPAIASGEDAVLGTLEPGKLADFVVLPADPERVAPEELRDMAVESTWINGRCVHSREKQG